ncbi:hypothetical protein SAMN05192534_1362 [Alteribacillus persepolensis]|uniref:Uncharacterized protein n=1 Tax=Alteribacillus persepolensis TaxID=568899 RepID=A0A1G8JQV3_9BACI|nr:hypothetical protein [Alteribacillus persepolensis]SDI33491.1 hypothetical protein SAMN05192534_1362 [Alteribacillus persepolensis]
MQKRFLLTAAAAAILTAAGCSSDNDAETNEEAANEEVEQAEEETGPSAQLDSDEALQESLAAEAEVEDAMVQVVDSDGEQSLNIDIQLAEGEEWNEEWLSKYEEIIRENYEEQPVDLIVAQGSELVTQETLE